MHEDVKEKPSPTRVGEGIPRPLVASSRLDLLMRPNVRQCLQCERLLMGRLAVQAMAGGWQRNDRFMGYT